MNDATLKMVLAGILFGVWPLLMSKSNLNGVSSTVMFTFVVLVFVLPIGIYNGLTLSSTNWWFAILAGCFGALGLLVFNSGLSKIDQKDIGQMFILMIVVQTSIPAIYHVYANGELTLKTTCGFIAAIVAAFLLV